MSNIDINKRRWAIVMAGVSASCFSAVLWAALYMWTESAPHSIPCSTDMLIYYADWRPNRIFAVLAGIVFASTCGAGMAYLYSWVTRP